MATSIPCGRSWRPASPSSARARPWPEPSPARGWAARTTSARFASATGTSRPGGSAALPQSPAEPAATVDVRPERTLWLLAIAHAVNHAQAVILPPIFLLVVAEFNIGVEAIPFLAAIGAVSSGLIQSTYGFVTRRVARRPILAAGGLLFGIGFAAQAITQSFATFSIANVISRIGGSPQHPVG